MIPKEEKEKVLKIIEEFNNEELDLINDFYRYIADFKGKYVYINVKFHHVVDVFHLSNCEVKRSET